MTTVNYYPNQSRLDFIGADGVPVAGMTGNIAHQKAISLAMEKNTIIAIKMDSQKEVLTNNKIKNRFI